jgi:hypothetical protein
VRPVNTLHENSRIEEFFYHRYYEVEHGAMAYPNRPDLWEKILKDFPEDMAYFKKHQCDACLLRWWDFCTAWTNVAICPSYVRMVESAEAEKRDKTTIESLISMMREKCDNFSLWVSDKANGGNNLHWPVR